MVCECVAKVNPLGFGRGYQKAFALLRHDISQGQVYEDKLDGKIDEAFWTRKMNESREQERTARIRAFASKRLIDC
jgi:hypothetical protein